ncbi:MAG: GIY-YIG nuclease family protein [Hydrogenophilaceae bacterium]|jgi:putative endonuclease|nr:GIY-YIG nuclease family protein [Hydrogenophilaceae bacterium]
MARYDLIAVYIMASRRNGTLYTGVTTDLVARALEHRQRRGGGFAAKYGCTLLVWWEEHPELNAAIVRETRIKAWRRAWKLALIEKANPTWRDLYDDFLLPPGAPKFEELLRKGDEE